jgi:signal peptidase II
MKILFVSAIMVLTDQISKTVVRNTMSLYESIPVIPEFFHLTYVTNDGMAFGINFPFGIYVFSAISIIFTGFLFWYLWSIKDDEIVVRTGVALILAGAIGNLIDRIFLGEVVDFLDFMIGDFHWYVFNLADSCVTVGLVFVLYDSLILNRKNASQIEQ